MKTRKAKPESTMKQHRAVCKCRNCGEEFAREYTFGHPDMMRSVDERNTTMHERQFPHRCAEGVVGVGDVIRYEEVPKNKKAGS